MVAEWAYEQLQIQVAESHRFQVQIPFGPIKHIHAMVSLLVNSKLELTCK